MENTSKFPPEYRIRRHADQIADVAAGKAHFWAMDLRNGLMVDGIAIPEGAMEDDIFTVDGVRYHIQFSYFERMPAWCIEAHYRMD